MRDGLNLGKQTSEEKGKRNEDKLKSCLGGVVETLGEEGKYRGGGVITR